MWNYVEMVLGCAGILVLFIVSAMMFWYLDPSLRRGREFTALLATRDAVSDEQMFSQYFSGGEFAPELPGRVRQLFARYTDYPAEKLLPDDDLLFFWEELDMADMIRDLEREFGIELSDKDITETRCTIRAVSHLVSRKLGANLD